MRKRVNIFFVMLAFMSVGYGLFLQYSEEGVSEVTGQEQPVVQEEIGSYETDMTDLDVVASEPD